MKVITVTRSFLILPLLTILFLSSCGGREGFKSPYTDDALELGVWRVEPTRDSLRSTLNERLPDIDNLWMKSDVTIRGDHIEGKKFFTAKVMYQEAGRLRFQGSRIPIGVLFDALLVDGEASLHFPREGRLFVGGGEELGEKLESIGGLQPTDFVKAILVLSALRERLNENYPIAIRQVGDKAIIGARDRESGYQFFWSVRLVDALVDEVLVRSPEGEEELRISYTEYREEETLGSTIAATLPYEFVMNIAKNRTRLEADVSEYRLDRVLPSAAWTAPRAREVFPLSSLNFEEPE